MGSVTSASLLVNLPAFDDAVRRACQASTLGVGLHFNLTAGSPLSPRGAVPSLCDQRTARFRQLPTLVARALAGRINPTEVAVECDAQIRRIREAGLRITHLDSHRHVHLLPGIWKPVMAVLDAELRLEQENRERIGAMMGSALAGVAYAEEQLGNFLRAGVRAVDPLLALTVFGGAASCNIAIEFGLRGPNMTNGMSCAAGAIAIGEAFHQIRGDYADIMLCGGAEAPLAPLCYGAFALIRAMSTRNDDPEHACRPFDRARDGFVMGEGAAVLVLEERERALARGAKVYAEVIGYGLTNDGYHMTAPLENGSQAGRAIALALADAELVPGEVQYLNAHGSSTLLNDPTETRAIKHVFGGSRHSSGGSACAEACAEAGPGPRTARSSRFFRWVSGRCRRSRPLSHSRSNVA